ncbi:hypothetical protein DM01DRAFT_1339977 [Hesseltinella vesiculosa]|uniref:Bromo domain-containing protein n=1 Tax=Hesseltinella vesiculosa TaxID=101127 RepID=A0A1X2G5A3_9FUNG|nr:hypothetical protein DM01DRAFT_1339977 [Hesseltinella vesiculosa]
MSTALNMEWSVLERLLLTQAVNKFGEDNWFQVARAMRQHPLLSQTKPEVFNQKTCSLQYYLMVEDLEKENRRRPKTADSVIAQDMPNVIKLARQLYAQRVDELKESIKADEDMFMQLISEIDEIKSGAWDDKLIAEYEAKAKMESTAAAGASPADIDTQVHTPDIADTPASQGESHSTDAHPFDLDTIQHPMDVDSTPSASITTSSQSMASTQLTEASAEPDQPSTSHPQAELHKSPVTPNIKLETPDASQSYPSLPTMDESSRISTLDSEMLESSDEPKLDEPILDEPTLDEPILDEPTLEEPTLEEPTLEEPTLEEPTLEEPAFDEPAHATNVASTDLEDETLGSKRPSVEDMDVDSENDTKRPRFEYDTNLSPPLEQDDEPDTVAPTLNEEPSGSLPAPATTKKSPSQEPAPIHTTHEVVIEPSPAVSTASPEINEKLEEGIDTGSDSNAATPSTTSATPTTVSSSIPATPAHEKQRKIDQRQKSWQKNINLLWRDIANHKNGAMFMNPIKEAQAPGYYKMVKYPLDLKGIKNRIRDGVIRTTVEFERDVILMLVNSLMYNQEDTEVYQLALEMLQDVHQQISDFKIAEGSTAPTPKESRRKSIAE